MSRKRSLSLDATSEDEGEPLIFRSSPIEDRASTFIGFYSTTLKPKELQNLAEIKSAMHKIVAWRRESNQQSINKSKQYVTGFDDDGEKYGGKKVERVLDSTQVEGTCVVARWYGGVMLGPVRFSHIEACAREAIRKWHDHERETTLKKRKLEQDAAEHVSLSKTLAERDQSISVLRQLALEKETLIKGVDESSGTPLGKKSENTASVSTATINTASVAVDYNALPLDRLKALEKARDATLAFLLKRIDKAEATLDARKADSKDSS